MWVEIIQANPFVPCSNFTDTSITPYLWSQVEASMAIICACLTTYRPLLMVLDFKLLSNRGWSRKSFSKLQGQSEGTTTGSEAPIQWPRRACSTSDKQLLQHREINGNVGNGDPHILELGVVSPALTPPNTANSDNILSASIMKADSWV